MDHTPVLSHRHIWGCLVFIPNEKAQGSKSPKWETRSRCDVYLGHRSTYTGSVVKDLKPKPLHVSPQYHIIFDDNFHCFINEKRRDSK